MILTASGITDNSGNPILNSSGAVVNTSYLNPTGEVSCSTGANVNYWSGSFTKLYSSSVTDLYVYAMVAGTGRYSGVCGEYVQVNGVNYYDFTYSYDGWSTADYRFWGQRKITGVESGTIGISVGHSTVNGSSTDRAFDYFNCAAGRNDGRRRPHNTYIYVYEVKK